MAQRKELLWSQLKVGLMTVFSLTVLGVAIFLITGATGFFAETMTVRTFSRDAGGLKSGAPVRLAGVDIGSVQSVGLSGRPELSQTIEVVMEVNRRYEAELREDSVVILAAEGLLGERYVNISRGTPDAPPVGPGGTITFHETAEFSELVGGSRDLIENLNVLTGRLNAILETVESGQGSIGKLIYDEGFYQRLENVAGGAEQLVADVNAGKGSLGRLLSDDALYEHASSAVAKLDSFAARIESGEGSIAKLVNDPSFYRNANQMVERASLLISNLNEGRGTMGKLITDDEFHRRLSSAVAGLDDVVTGLRNGDGTMGRLLHDPVLFNSLNASSVEIRSLLADFRRDPKKFLTIQFKIF